MERYHPFIEEFGAAYGLSVTEKKFLRSAEIRSSEQLHEFLTITPGLPDCEGLETQIFRSGYLLRSAERHAFSTKLPRSGLRLAPPKTSRPLHFASGAAPPSVKTIENIKIPEILGGDVPITPADDRLDAHGQGHLRIARLTNLATWRPKEQGEHRNTCIAFATAACVELDAMKQDGTTDLLSEQFLYWNMRTKIPIQPPPGWEKGATTFEMARQVLHEKGICLDTACHYQKDLPAGSLIEGPAPDCPADVQARQRRVMDENAMQYPADLDPGNDHRPTKVARMLLDLLRSGRPVGIAVPVFQPIAGAQNVLAPEDVTNWSTQNAWRTGQVQFPTKGWKSRGMGHAVCVIGFQPDAHEPMGGWFEFRNSYGTSYADEPLTQAIAGHWPETPAAGYGLISATYVESYCWEMLAI